MIPFPRADDRPDISVLVGVIGDRDGSDGLALHTI